MTQHKSKLVCLYSIKVALNYSYMGCLKILSAVYDPTIIDNNTHNS